MPWMRVRTSVVLSRMQCSTEGAPAIHWQVVKLNTPHASAPALNLTYLLYAHRVAMPLALYSSYSSWYTPALTGLSSYILLIGLARIDTRSSS